MKHRIVLFLKLSFTALLAAAQSFTAKIEPVGGYYRLTFTVASNHAEGFTPPNLSAFEKLSGPMTSTFSSYQMVNGRSSHESSTTFTYILSAKKSGNLTIGAASVKVNGKVLHSAPVTLHATAGSTAGSGSQSGQGRQGRSEDDEPIEVQQAGSAVTQRDLFIDVTPSRTRVMEQEAVLLTYRIHSRVGVGLANTQLTTKPDFKGLISHELPLPGNQIQTTIEQRNGTTYRTGTILQYVIFPQQAGKLTIPSITFDCTVVQQDHTLDLADAFFNGGGSIGVQVRRTVSEAHLQIDSLPQPKPAAFAGAVGRFSLSGKVLNPTLRTNDVATYRLTVKGVGNLRLITPPVVTFPQDFDSYDAKTTDQTKVTAEGLDGQLTFDYTFVPRNVGKYTIPAIEFAYYDTETHSYRTLRTQPVELQVEKGERSNDDVDRQLALLRSDIRDIHTAQHTGGPSQSFVWGSWAYRLLEAILLAAFALAAWLLRRMQSRRADVTTRKRSRAAKTALARLDKAEKSLQADTRQGYAEIGAALSGFLCDALNLQTAETDKEHALPLLLQRGADAATAEAFFQVVDDCQYAQYAPASDTEADECLQRARHTVGQLAGQLGRKVH
ncbi:MAG: BatD family protein [Alloprevotella sp.]